MVDTSTEAVTKLLDGVTPGPWIAESGHVQQNGQLYWQVTDKNDAIMQNQFCWCQGDHAANARFIAAARDLVPALLAERDAMRRENENLRHIERNVQAVREHEYNRAEAALADVERLIAQTITVNDAVKVPEIAALIEKVERLFDVYEEAGRTLGKSERKLKDAMMAITEGEA